MQAVEPRLYIFPHAGGTAEFYAPFAQAFPAPSRIKCVAVQYPGKKAGRDLSRYNTIPELADRICAMLQPEAAPGRQIFLFGHSMGALVAFEVALRFEVAANPVAGLFVSACAAPGLMRPDLQGSDQELLRLVADVTGANPEFLNNEQFAATLLPTLRGLKAIAAYDCADDATVSCPVHGAMADNDELGTADLMTPWGDRTAAGFELAVFPGDHFYINANLPRLAHWTEERIRARI